jgi:hypothetical protein
VPTLQALVSSKGGGHGCSGGGGGGGSWGPRGGGAGRCGVSDTWSLLGALGPCLTIFSRWSREFRSRDETNADIAAGDLRVCQQARHAPHQHAAHTPPAKCGHSSPAAQSVGLNTRRSPLWPPARQPGNSPARPRQLVTPTLTTQLSPLINRPPPPKSLLALSLSSSSGSSSSLSTRCSASSSLRSGQRCCRRPHRYCVSRRRPTPRQLRNSRACIRKDLLFLLCYRFRARRATPHRARRREVRRTNPFSATILTH